VQKENAQHDTNPFQDDTTIDQSGLKEEFEIKNFSPHGL